MATQQATATRSPAPAIIVGIISLALVASALMFFKLAWVYPNTVVYSPLIGISYLLAIPLAFIALIRGRRARHHVATTLGGIALLGLVGELVAYVIYVANTIM